jgi:site-specific DNA-adenine methylase
MSALQALYYMGAKARQLPEIMPRLLPLLEQADEFREPFAGSGVVSLAVMARCPRLSFWLNDRDPAMACLWWALRYHGSKLVKLIEAFEPTPEAFQAFKVETESLVNPPDDPNEIIRIGFMKFARHQVSHSGYGSGIRGGRHQEVFTKMGARWNGDRIRKNMLIIANRLNRCDVRITGYDWYRLLDGDPNKRICYYLDPPYLLNQNDCDQKYYSYGFEDEDHARLAEMLKLTPHRWVLTSSSHSRSVPMGLDDPARRARASHHPRSA